MKQHQSISFYDEKAKICDSTRPAGLFDLALDLTRTLNLYNLICTFYIYLTPV
jgi:hypothetical protein